MSISKGPPPVGYGRLSVRLLHQNVAPQAGGGGRNMFRCFEVFKVVFAFDGFVGLLICVLALICCAVFKAL